MKTEFIKALRKHEFIALFNGALFVLFAFSMIYGPRILRLVPEWETIPSLRYTVYGLWALCVGGLSYGQWLLRKSRVELTQLARQD